MNERATSAPTVLSTSVGSAWVKLVRILQVLLRVATFNPQSGLLNLKCYVNRECDVRLVALTWLAVHLPASLRNCCTSKLN